MNRRDFFKLSAVAPVIAPAVVADAIANPAPKATDAALTTSPTVVINTNIRDSYLTPAMVRTIEDKIRCEMHSIKSLRPCKRGEP